LAPGGRLIFFVLEPQRALMPGWVLVNKDRQNVLYFVDRYLPASQAFVAQQAKALTRYSPSVLASRRIDTPSARLAQLPVTDISSSLPLRASEAVLKVAGLPSSPLTSHLKKADIVHAHFGKNGYVLGPVARAARRPLVTTFHGFDATFDGDPRTPGGFNQVRFFQKGRREMAERGEWAIAVSRFIRDKLLAHGFPPNRIRQHYIGIDTKLFDVPQRPRLSTRIVSIARFVEYKGHRLMIEALEKVAASGVPFEFVMVGQGPLREEIESHARKRLPSVTIFDSLSQAEIASLLAEARLYLHGSVTLANGHAEAFGLANVEAQAVGTPVVAFDSGGVAEALVQGQTGFAVAERDTETMATHIQSLLTDDAQWESFSRAAARMVRERFDIVPQTAALEDIYDEIIAHYAAGARA
jgi:colanic acid/amylovoran biosynthesis glycosyltransferase